MHEVTIFDAFINPAVVPNYVSYAFLASALLIAVAIVIRVSISLVPKGIQNFVETLVEAMFNLSVENIGHEYGEFFFPLICTLFMYILTCNLFGLVPGFDSPTANINVTASLAVPVFFIYQLWGFKVHGFRYIKHFLGPIQSIYALPLMMFMFATEVISHIARPLTIAVRLFGNMFAKHLMLLVLAVLLPLFVPDLILLLGFGISIVQAFVFTLLASVYIAGAVQEAH